MQNYAKINSLNFISLRIFYSAFNNSNTIPINNNAFSNFEITIEFK